MNRLKKLHNICRNSSKILKNMILVCPDMEFLSSSLNGISFHDCGLQIETVFRTVGDLGDRKKINLWGLQLLEGTLICGNSVINGFRGSMMCKKC